MCSHGYSRARELASLAEREDDVQEADEPEYDDAESGLDAVRSGQG